MIEKFLLKSVKVFKFRLLIVLLVLIITTYFALHIQDLRTDNNVTNMLPDSDIAKQNFRKYEKIFGSSVPIVIGIKSNNIFSKEVLNYIKKIEEKAKEVNYFLPVQNIAEYLKISKDDAQKIIDVLSEEGVIEPVDIKNVLNDKEKLKEEYDLDDDFIKEIEKKLKGIDYKELFNLYSLPVKNTTSIISGDFIKGKGNKFIVKKLLEGEINENNIKKLKKNLDSWEMYKGGLISNDKKMTAILIELKDGVGERVVNKTYLYIKNIANKYKPKGVEIYISGEPVVTNIISIYMINDLKILIPIAVFVVIFTLLLSFKNFEGVIYPLLAVGLSTIWAVGFMAVLKIPFNIVTTVMPVLLLAVGSAYGIHFMNYYFLSKEKDKEKAIYNNFSSVAIAIVMAALTTIAGFSSLITTQFIPIRNFGLFTSIGIFFALIITLYFIPSLILLIKKKKTNYNQHKDKKGIIIKVLKKLSFLAREKTKTIQIFSIILIIIFLIGIFFLKVEMNMITFFKKNADIRIADNTLNKYLSGTQILNVVFVSKNKSEIIEPDVLYKIEDLNNKLKEKFPIIKKVISINDYLKKMNQEMYNGKKSFYRLPETKEKIKDYLLLYSGKLDSVITDKKDMLRIIINMKRVSSEKTKEIEDFIKKYFKNNETFFKTHNIKPIITGAANLQLESNKLIVKGQIISLLVSLIIVFFINLFVFKDIKLTLISLLPICITLIINFGLMGYLGITLNAGTAMIASLAIGIGIDYAIHFIVKYLREIKEYKDINIAIDKTIMETGRGIIYNVLTVSFGFLVLMFSKFVILIQFGMFVALNMIITGIGALLIIPVVLKTLKKEV